MKKSILFFLLLFFPLLNSMAANSFLLAESASAELKQLLSLSLEELLQVEIDTAGKVSEKIGKIPASVVLITRQDIQRYGYTTLDEILRHVSGVYHLNFYGTGGASYGVRGYLSTSTANRNMIVLVNGISQVSDYDSSYLLPTVPVPVEAIDRIEIIRGPQSTIYGSGAFFGVINLITNETNQKKGAASYVSLLGGSRQTRRWFGRSSYVYDQEQIVVNLGGYQHDGFDVPYQRLESKPQGQEWDYRTGGRMESEEKYFELSGTYQNLQLDITHGNTDTEGFVSRPVIGDGTNRHLESTHLRVSYHQKLSNQLNLNGHLTYIHNDIRLDYDSPFPSTTTDFQTIQSTAYEGEVTLQWKLPKYLDLTSGIYYRYAPDIASTIDLPGLPNVVSLQKATQRLQSGDSLVNQAWFSQVNYYPNQRWKWVAGLRLEQTLGYDVFAEYGANSTQYKSITPHYDAQEVAVGNYH
jgi:outer membrane cobalamin receptor